MDSLFEDTKNSQEALIERRSTCAREQPYKLKTELV